MEKVADTYRLQNRKGTWYYVRRVPLNLVSLIGKRFVKVSLATKNKAEAKARRTLISRAIQRGLTAPIR